MKYELLSTVIAFRVRKGQQVGCDARVFKNLKLHPEVAQKVITDTLKIDKTKTLYFAGDLDNVGQIWRAYLAKNQSTWKVA